LRFFFNVQFVYIVYNKRVQTKMWAFDLPLWAYVLVGFCPMGFCPMGFCPTLYTVNSLPTNPALAEITLNSEHWLYYTLAAG